MRETKTETLRFRCTPSDKHRIEQIALNYNISISDYLLDSALAGRRSKPRIRKQYLCRVVNLQEKINVIKSDFNNYEDVIPKEYCVSCINEFQEEVGKLCHIL